MALGAYSDRSLRALLHEYKYNGVQEAREAVLGLFSAFLACRVPLLESRCSQEVLCVPMHYLREASRGFNQASELAGAVSMQLGLPLRVDYLGRRWRFRRQVELEGRGEARRQNSIGSFFVSETFSSVKSVMLVDDVVTSGATLAAAAAVLKEAGVGEVHGVTFLRG